jgi:hypothetical protein
MQVTLTCLDERQPVITFVTSTLEEIYCNGVHTFLFDLSPTRRSASFESLYGRASILRSIDGGFVTSAAFSPSLSDVMKQNVRLPESGVVYNAQATEDWLARIVSILLCLKHSQRIAATLLKWQRAQEEQEEQEELKDAQENVHMEKEIALPPLLSVSMDSVA